MRHRRLLVAQGPSQLISALAVWEYIASQPGASLNAWEDVLVLGGFCVPDNIAQELERFCRQIARNWKFARIISTRAHDAALESGQTSFEKYLEIISGEVGADEVQELYVCRNMQPLNEAVLFGWPKAKKICYGDLGIIDLNGLAWSKPSKECGYPQVDEIMSHAPVEMTAGIFDKFPLARIPLLCFINALTKASLAIEGLDAFCQDLGKNAAGRKILICLSNFTEGGNVGSVEEEVRFYESCLAPYLQKESTVFVKGHPRETMDQASQLTERLRSKGIDARCFTGMSTVPVDLFARNLRIDLLLTLFSHSGVSWRLVQPETDIVIGVPEAVQKFIRPEAQALYHYDEVTALYYLLSLMATRREYRPVRMERVRGCLKLVPPRPILLNGRKSEDGDCLEIGPLAASFYESVVGAEEQPRPNKFPKWLPSLPFLGKMLGEPHEK